MVLSFSSAVTVLTVNLNIVDDDVLETDENFTAVIELVNSEDKGRIMLQPNKRRSSIYKSSHN